MGRVLSLADLRRFAISRSLSRPTTLGRALARMGFLQADPIRAPARAQDLILRHRVTDYRAGDLEARYPRLPFEEEYFINYGFLPTSVAALLHPRVARRQWSATEKRRSERVLEFVRDRGTVHPDDVDAEFAHGRATNWFGGQSRVSTQLLDGMHYRGLLRIVRRENGVRVYGVREAPRIDGTLDEALDSLVDVLLAVYAPLPRATFSTLVTRMLWLGAPQWQVHRKDAVRRALTRVEGETVDGVQWVWPAGERPRSSRHAPDEQVRLLAPFDPIVWERRRFESFWGWAYRFEAYTPAAKRVRGYYALPLLWRDAIVGWGNLSVVDGRLHAELGYVSGAAPRERAFHEALAVELRAMSRFLDLPT